MRAEMRKGFVITCFTGLHQVMTDFVGIDNGRFKQPVEPGDQLILTVHFKRNVRNIWQFSAEATVDGNVAASADIMCASKVIED